MRNIVYIATSLDGYIADRDGGLDWLTSIPNPENDDMGWSDFLASIDGIIMGRKTFEKVCGFECPWPYPVPVFVLSNSLKKVPAEYEGKAEIVSGELEQIVHELNSKGFERLYIDGGKTVQSFLQKDMIDELIISRIPVLLGGGIPLFGELAEMQKFDHIKTEVLLSAIVQSHYRRKR
jgi:dihydrofolate reductase